MIFKVSPSLLRTFSEDNSPRKLLERFRWESCLHCMGIGVKGSRLEKRQLEPRSNLVRLGKEGKFAKERIEH